MTEIRQSCRRTVPAVFLAGVLAIGGCVTPSMQESSRSPDQAQLDQYADSYMLQGAAIGAVLGAAAGCGLMAAIGEDCAAGAIGGGVIGAGAGALGGRVIATNQQTYASEEQRLEALAASAEQELQQAQAARRASERVVATHREELDRLQNQVAANQADSAQLQAALNEAERDRQQMVRARDGLSSQVAVLNEAVLGPNADSDLVQQRNALRAEVDLLDEQIEALTGEIQSVEGVV